MKNKGFTLIELLAVIIIIGLIAVITIPKINDSIESSKQNLAKTNALNYKKTIEEQKLKEQLNKNIIKLNGDYSINSNGNIENNNQELELEISGEKPKNGYLTYIDDELESGCITINKYAVTLVKDEVTNVEKGDCVEIAQEKINTIIRNAKNIASQITGQTEIKNIENGWVAFINGEVKAYSVSVTEGAYTYVVTDLDVDSSNSHAVADRTISEVASTTQAEQIIINYYSNQVATEVSSYISSLLADSTIQGYTEDTPKKVSDISTPSAPTGTDTNSWIYFKKETSSVSASDYSIKITKGDYSFVVNCVDGTVSSPVYNGSLENQKMPPSFANDSWATIKANLALNRNYYRIGSEKIVNMNLEGTAKDYKLRLSNTESCSNDWQGSKTACGVVIEFVTTIGIHTMNDSLTNAGGWYASGMRSYLNSGNDSIYSKLNAVIGKDSSNNDIIISTTPVISGSGEGQTSPDAEDYLYLLSTREVGFNASNDNKNATTDTNILSYYNINNNNESRIKYNQVTNGTAQNWWLRSAPSSSTSNFYGVGRVGTNYNTFAKNYDSGVAPAFRILD